MYCIYRMKHTIFTGLDYTQLVLDAFTFGIYGAIKTHQKILTTPFPVERSNVCLDISRVSPNQEI